MYVFILSAITAVGHLGAIVGLCGSINIISSASSAKWDGERHNRGWWSSGSKTRAPPLSTWLFRRISEAPDPRQSWAGGLGTSGRGSVVPSMSALYLGDPQEVGVPGRLALV